MLNQNRIDKLIRHAKEAEETLEKYSAPHEWQFDENGHYHEDYLKQCDYYQAVVYGLYMRIGELVVGQVLYEQEQAQAAADKLNGEGS